MARSTRRLVSRRDRPLKLKVGTRITSANVLWVAAILMASWHAILCGQESKEACPCPIGTDYAASSALVTVSSSSTQPGLIVCGYLDKRRDKDSVIASEFGVFECRSNKPILELDALRSASVVAQANGLFITELTYWPFGPGWKWIDVPVREFVIAAGAPPVVKERFVLNPPRVLPSQIRAVLRAFEALRRSKVSSRDEARQLKTLENLIGRLLVAALSGDTGASTAFRSMRDWLNSLERPNAGGADLYDVAEDVYNAYAQSKGDSRTKNQ